MKEENFLKIKILIIINKIKKIKYDNVMFELYNI
jgi:hypothetical protein